MMVTWRVLLHLLAPSLLTSTAYWSCSPSCSNFSLPVTLHGPPVHVWEATAELGRLEGGPRERSGARGLQLLLALLCPPHPCPEGHLHYHTPMRPPASCQGQGLGPGLRQQDSQGEAVAQATPPVECVALGVGDQLARCYPPFIPSKRGDPGFRQSKWQGHHKIESEIDSALKHTVRYFLVLAANVQVGTASFPCQQDVGNTRRRSLRDALAPLPWLFGAWQ